MVWSVWFLAADGCGVIQPGAFSSCCGSTVYDWWSQVCCGSDHVLHDRLDSNTACCGNETYQRNTAVCCFSHPTYSVQNSTYGKNSKCCGNTVYDHSSHGCCNNLNVYNKSIAVSNLIEIICKLNANQMFSSCATSVCNKYMRFCIVI